MVTLSQLWVPILASAVAVFVLSSLVHMVLKWNNADYRKLSNEDEVRTALQKTDPAPGQYVVPHCTDMKLMQTPEFQQKFTDGPVGFIVLRARGAPNMGPALGLWFLYSVAIAIFSGYLASRSLSAGASAASVFRLVATVAFLAFGGGQVQQGIWMGKPWGSVAKELLDALIYAAGIGVVFGALWPH
jgi:hypothetical protein